MRVYWLSRHQLSPAQLRAIKDLHGEDVEIVHEPITLEGDNGLLSAITERSDGFIYAVAGAHHILVAATCLGCRFGVFANHPAKRTDGQFGLAAVYHVFTNTDAHQDVHKVWVNSDPESDEGEALIPLERRR